MRIGVGSVPGFVSVAGNIGAGKTTLLDTVSKHESLQVYPEEPEKNAFFTSFSEDMKKWALPTQLTYFVEFMNKAMVAENSEKMGIVERTISENVEVFIKNLFESKAICSEDFCAMMKVYDRIKFSIPKPKTIFFIRADVSVLIERIERRARPGERVNRKYLEDLQALYSTWIETIDYCDVVMIDGNQNKDTVAEQFLRYI